MPRLLNTTKNEQVSIRLTAPTVSALDKIAAERGSSRSAIAADILEVAKHLEPERFYQALAAFEKAAKLTG